MQNSRVCLRPHHFHCRDEGERITTADEEQTVASGHDGNMDTPGAYVVDGNHPEAEHPYQAMDGDVATKFLDFTKGDLLVNFGAPVSVASYDWATANDFMERDPTKWTLPLSIAI